MDRNCCGKKLFVKRAAPSGGASWHNRNMQSGRLSSRAANPMSLQSGGSDGVVGSSEGPPSNALTTSSNGLPRGDSWLTSKSMREIRHELCRPYKREVRFWTTVLYMHLLLSSVASTFVVDQSIKAAIMTCLAILHALLQVAKRPFRSRRINYYQTALLLSLAMVTTLFYPQEAGRVGVVTCLLSCFLFCECSGGPASTAPRRCGLKRLLATAESASLGSPYCHPATDADGPAPLSFPRLFG